MTIRMRSAPVCHDTSRARAIRTCSVRLATFIVLSCVLAAGPASAQIQVPWFRGALGLRAASSPPPGVTAISALTWYSASDVKDRNGNTIASGDLDIFAPFVAFTYTAREKILGARWGSMIAVTLATTALDLPAVDVETGIGPGDLYIRPLNFGWHWSRVDLTLAYGLFLPTGRYVPGGSENTGLGMWSNEYDLGLTVYPDRKRRWNVSTLAAYQSQSEKRGTQRRAGSTLTLYGGAGYAFKPLANAGLAYYAQWKVSDDEFANLPADLVGRHRMLGIGPQLDWPIDIRPRPLIATARYFFEFGNRVATEGGTLYVGLTYIVPSRR